jgi:hypothetical protein
MLPPATLNNPQELSAVINGPGSATRLYICTGEAFQGVTASGAGTNQVGTLHFLVGPTLQEGQFVRAVVSAGISRASFGPLPGSTTTSGGTTATAWNIDSADADWDDESGRVEVRIQVQVTAGRNVVTLAGVSYNVSILAALPTN